MTEQVTEERRTDQINLSHVAASKVKSLLEQEGRDDLAAAHRRAAWRLLAVCATSCSSTSAPSTATSSPTSTAWPSSSTG